MPVFRLLIFNNTLCCAACPMECNLETKQKSCWPSKVQAWPMMGRVGNLISSNEFFAQNGNTLLQNVLKSRQTPKPTCWGRFHKDQGGPGPMPRGRPGSLTVSRNLFKNGLGLHKIYHLTDPGFTKFVKPDPCLLNS